MNHQSALDHFIPNSLCAIETLNLALRLRGAWEEAQPMKLLINDKLTVEGNSNAFTNPAIEAGVIHCRAMLEFLGLAMSKAGALVQLAKPRRVDDIGIENFSNENGPLPMVTPEQAVARYLGGAAEAEQALVSVFRIANKGLAHLTAAFVSTPDDARLLEIASRGVPSLVVSHLYTPLGLPAPVSQVVGRAA